MLADDEWRELAALMRRNANLFRLPAHPVTWPDWMTPEKRQEMAAAYEHGAALIENGEIQKSRRAVP